VIYIYIYIYIKLPTCYEELEEKSGNFNNIYRAIKTNGDRSGITFSLK
jgi:hypothetical protein